MGTKQKAKHISVVNIHIPLRSQQAVSGDEVPAEHFPAANDPIPAYDHLPIAGGAKLLTRAGTRPLMPFMVKSLHNFAITSLSPWGATR